LDKHGAIRPFASGFQSTSCRTCRLVVLAVGGAPSQAAAICRATAPAMVACIGCVWRPGGRLKRAGRVVGRTSSDASLLRRGNSFDCKADTGTVRTFHGHCKSEKYIS